MISKIIIYFVALFLKYQIFQLLKYCSRFLNTELLVLFRPVHQFLFQKCIRRIHLLVDSNHFYLILYLTKTIQ